MCGKYSLQSKITQKGLALKRDCTVITMRDLSHECEWGCIVKVAFSHDFLPEYHDLLPESLMSRHERVAGVLIILLVNMRLKDRQQ